MTNNILSNNGKVEVKICKDCWYYKPEPTTNKINDDPESAIKFPFCYFYNDCPSVKPDDTCKHWESNKLKMISIIQKLYGR